MSLLEQFRETIGEALGQTTPVPSVPSQTPAHGTGFPLANQSSPIGPIGPITKQGCQGANGWERPALSGLDQAAIHEAIEERAAILEHEAHLPRPQAETQAARAMRVYRYRLTDHPDWLTLIAPGCDLEEARRALVSRFGAERVLDIQAHQPFASEEG
ncbi:hypothetical protein [Thiocystis violacea]|uniref:hypothetical protein n=1 Tax=Thiocystis violacea TaxID=13725 RepID=UPI0019087258|nr:hypothetical protein [Thiocystis violacea]MBK1716671.1 hypothetical protein [Thiocystis violacea]